MNSDAFDISASNESTFSIDTPIHGTIHDLHNGRRLARRQRLQQAIESLKQLKEIGGVGGESELGHLPPAA